MPSVWKKITIQTALKITWQSTLKRSRTHMISVEIVTDWQVLINHIYIHILEKNHLTVINVVIFFFKNPWRTTWKFIQNWSLSCSLCGMSFFMAYLFEITPEKSVVWRIVWALFVGNLLLQMVNSDTTKEFKLEKNLTSVHAMTRDSVSQDMRGSTLKRSFMCSLCGKSFTWLRASKVKNTSRCESSLRR